MATEGTTMKVDHQAPETVETLTREIEQLKARLEEERKKLNDVARESMLWPGLLESASELRLWERKPAGSGKRDRLRRDFTCNVPLVRSLWRCFLSRSLD